MTQLESRGQPEAPLLNQEAGAHDLYDLIHGVHLRHGAHDLYDLIHGALMIDRRDGAHLSE